MCRVRACLVDMLAPPIDNVLVYIAMFAIVNCDVNYRTVAPH